MNSDEGKRRYEPINVNELTQEEIQMYKSCSYNLLMKFGFPIALGLDLISAYTAKVRNTTIPLSKRFFKFFGIAVLTQILLSPSCTRQLKEFHEQNVAENKHKETKKPEPVTEALTVKPEDFNYPVDSISNLIETETSFSSDYSAPFSGLLLEDEKTPVKRVTYEELRMRNRALGTYTPTEEVPPPTVTPSEPPSNKKVRRNKYGDEID